MADDLSVNPPGEVSLPGQPEQHMVPRGPRWVFFGSDGLRAGWSALVFVVMTYALLLGIGSVARLLFHPHSGSKSSISPLTALVIEAISAGSVLIATWIMSRIEKRRVSSYGYAGGARLSRFMWGALFGVVALSALVGVLWRSHLVAFNPGHLGGITALKYGAIWFGVFFLTGIFEESGFRGYLQYTLTRGLNFWWGALILSCLFGAVHSGNSGESPIGVISAGAAGFVFCISLWYTGSLWWAIGFHTAWDWAETFFYGTSDSGMVAQGHFLNEHPVGPLLWSGGPTGPEGSLYIVPLLLIMALAMWLWWRRSGVTAPYQQESSPVCACAWSTRDPL